MSEYKTSKNYLDTKRNIENSGFPTVFPHSCGNHVQIYRVANGYTAEGVMKIAQEVCNTLKTIGVSKGIERGFSVSVNGTKYKFKRV